MDDSLTNLDRAIQNRFYIGEEFKKAMIAKLRQISSEMTTTATNAKGDAITQEMMDEYKERILSAASRLAESTLEFDFKGGRTRRSRRKHKR